MTISILASLGDSVDFQNGTGLTKTPASGSSRAYIVFGSGWRNTVAIRTVSNMTMNVSNNSDIDQSYSGSVSPHPFICGFKQGSIANGDLAITWNNTLDHTGHASTLELEGVDQDWSALTTTEASISSTSLTIPGFAVNAGDIVLLSVAKSSNTDFSGFTNNGGAHGYTQLGNIQPTMGGSTRRLRTYYKIAPASQTDNLVFSWSGTVTGTAKVLVMKPAGGAAGGVPNRVRSMRGGMIDLSTFKG